MSDQDRIAELETISRALIKRVEGPFGYGTLRNSTPDGTGVARLKDTKEWVTFYNAINSSAPQGRRREANRRGEK